MTPWTICHAVPGRCSGQQISTSNQRIEPAGGVAFGLRPASSSDSSAPDAGSFGGKLRRKSARFALPWGINTFLRSSFPLQKFPPCVILLGMRKLTEHERLQVREERRGDLMQHRDRDRADLLQTYGLHCLRCEYQWLPRVGVPTRCPRCRSSYWDTPRENRQGMRPGT